MPLRFPAGVRDRLAPAAGLMEVLYAVGAKEQGAFIASPAARQSEIINPNHPHHNVYDCRI